MTPTTLDAAIKSAHVEAGFGETFQILPANREYARALIAKLLEGMEEPACPAVVEANQQAYAAFCLAHKRTLTEIRRRAGLEVES